MYEIQLKKYTMKLIKLSVLLALVALPAMAWTFVKPVRVIAPELTGITCFHRICIDDVARKAEAEKLYQEALVFVNTHVDTIAHPPRAIFCSTKACSEKFGLYNGSYAHAAAYNVATYGIAISYRGWKPYFVRHELIHHLQNEKLGNLNAYFFKPEWFKEGMAYTLSQDPRDPLPASLEAFRQAYLSWAGTIDNNHFWKAASKL